MVGLEDLTNAIRKGVNSSEMKENVNAIMAILAKVYEKGFCDAIDIASNK